MVHDRRKRKYYWEDEYGRVEEWQIALWACKSGCLRKHLRNSHLTIYIKCWRLLWKTDILRYEFDFLINYQEVPSFSAFLSLLLIAKRKSPQMLFTIKTTEENVHVEVQKLLKSQRTDFWTLHWTKFVFPYRKYGKFCSYKTSRVARFSIKIWDKHGI